MRDRATAVGLTVVLLGAGSSGCGDSGPSTQAQVCSAYSALESSMGSANGIFDNAIFDRAGDLGDAASRFEGNAGVRSDGAALQAIAGSDSTTFGEVIGATGNISAMCG